MTEPTSPGVVKSLLSLFEKNKPTNNVNPSIGETKNISDKRVFIPPTRPDMFQFPDSSTKLFENFNKDIDAKETNTKDTDEISQLHDKISVKTLITKYQKLTNTEFRRASRKLELEVLDKNIVELDTGLVGKREKAHDLFPSKSTEERISILAPFISNEQTTAKCAPTTTTDTPPPPPSPRVYSAPMTMKEKKAIFESGSIKTISDIKQQQPSVEDVDASASMSQSSFTEKDTKSYFFQQIPPQPAYNMQSNKSESSDMEDSKTHDTENLSDDTNKSEEEEDDEYSLSDVEGFAPLPSSYTVINKERGHLELILPPPNKSIVKVGGKSNKTIAFSDETNILQTYSVIEYERGDQTVDPISASAEYEIEKKIESLDKYSITLKKDARGLGLSILGIGLGAESGAERLGIFIKSLTPNGVAEKTAKIQVQDQIIEVDGTSLVGVSQKFAAETLKGTGETVTLLMGKKKKKLNNSAG